MSADHKKHHVGHRQRLKDKFLLSRAEDFADYELLELFIFLIQPRRDVKPLAKNLLLQYGNLGKIFSLNEEEANKLMGKQSGVYLKLFKEISRRISKDKLLKQPIISSNQQLLDYLRLYIGNNHRESFIILFLNKQNMLIKEEIITTGTVDQTAIYPREIIKKALSLDSTAIIMVHNHPSGNQNPSPADVQITKQIQQIATSLNISLHDHIIITSEKHFSFKKNGLL